MNWIQWMFIILILIWFARISWFILSKTADGVNAMALIFPTIFIVILAACSVAIVPAKEKILREQSHYQYVTSDSIYIKIK